MIPFVANVSGIESDMWPIVLAGNLYFAALGYSPYGILLIEPV